MTDLDPNGQYRAHRHVGDETSVADPTDRTPAWMLTPRAVRIPYLTDPP